LPDPSFQNPIGAPFIELQSVDSTNNYALARVHAGLAQHGETFLAHEQLAGKGQRGKTWTAEKGSSLLTSIIINPYPLTIDRQFQLSACAAVSACGCLNKYGAGDFKIKWPNDIYWQDRKAGGILIENVIGVNRDDDSSGKLDRAWKWAVVGIGININQKSFDNQLINPVSLLQITGKEHDPVAIAMELYSVMGHNWRQIINGNFVTLYNYYIDHLYKLNEKLRFKAGNRSFEAVIKGVSTSGRLILEHGVEEEYATGEIEFVLK